MMQIILYICLAVLISCVLLCEYRGCISDDNIILIILRPIIIISLGYFAFNLPSLDTLQPVVQTLLTMGTLVTTIVFTKHSIFRGSCKDENNCNNSRS